MATNTYDIGSAASGGPYTLADYDKMFLDGESADKQDFSEKRSNVLLKAGEHFNRRRLNLYRKLRDHADISDEMKVRITKNHIGNICKIYSNHLTAAVPGIGTRPKDEKSSQDQKKSALYSKILEDAKQVYALDEKRDDWADAMVDISEVATKVFYNPNGNIDGKRFVFEDVFGFNLIRPRGCTDLRQAQWLCIRKMVDIDDLKATFPDKRNIINASPDETMRVFDSQTGNIRDVENELMLREFYFRPCARYQQGWFAWVVRGGILVEGELPFGVFPIAVEPIDKAPTSPRGISPIRTMRPYQVEINRCSSKIAETHTTVGDDKVILSNGAKFSSTAEYPGIRAFGATGGATPVVIPGRDGSQFVPHLQNTITELYQVMNVSEFLDDDDSAAQIDPHMLMYRSAKQKRKFKRYISRFERFMIEVATIYLQLARKSLTDEELIEILGRDEMDNIVELRTDEDIMCEIVIEGSNEDLETEMGKQFMIQHALQYVGPNMSQDDVGKLLRMSKIGNFEGMFSSLTQNYDNLENDILALDRGERPPVHPGDDHVYMSAGLNYRIRKPDFKHLPPQIQMNYQAKIMLHDKFEAWKQVQIQRAKAGYIPTGGYMVVCDLYVPDPRDPEKTMRARIPYESLQWLLQQLETQNMGIAELDKMASSQQLSVAQRMQELQGGAQHPMAAAV